MSKTKPASKVIRLESRRVRAGHGSARSSSRSGPSVDSACVPYFGTDITRARGLECLLKGQLRQDLRRRLVADRIYFMPAQFLAEALQITIAALCMVLSESEFEIVRDVDGELTEILGKFHNLECETNLFVTTFGLQKLMLKRI